MTLKTPLVTDGEPHRLALSAAGPGKLPDKTLSAHLQTVARWPAGGEAAADKGSQGRAEQVCRVTVPAPETGAEHQVPRRAVKTPFKQPPGQELPPDQHAFTTHLSQVRVRLEPCSGWVKNWAIIATRFRWAHTIYPALLRTICAA